MIDKKKNKKVYIKANDLLDLIHWARRYADRRCTYVPRGFNRIYEDIMSQYPFLKQHEFIDETLKQNGKFFPYASDGNFSENEVKIHSRCF